MTDWTPQDDWSQVKVGDTVRAERDGCVITGKVSDRYILSFEVETHALVVNPAGLLDSFCLDRDEWQLSVPAKPAVELPTEPGHYLDREGNGWHIRKGATSSLPEEWAPYTRLEPVAVTAKLVIDQFRLGKSITTVAEIFGVSDD